VPTVLALRAVLAVAGLAGALLLMVATFTTIIEITVGTTGRGLDFDAAQSGGDRHGPALIVLALLALWLLAAALRGARIAMTGLALTGLVALAIAVHWDRSHVHDTGSVGEVYTEATANPGTGYDPRRRAARAVGRRATRAGAHAGECAWRGGGGGACVF
jgi:hypothetical protein